MLLCAGAHVARVEEGARGLWGRKCDVVYGFLTNLHVKMHVYHATLTHYVNISQ